MDRKVGPTQSHCLPAHTLLFFSILDLHEVKLGLQSSVLDVRGSQEMRGGSAKMKRFRSERRIVNVLVPSDRADIGTNSVCQRPYQIGQGLVFVLRLYEDIDAAREKVSVVSCGATE